MANHDGTATVTQLIQTCNDSKRNFYAAAEQIENRALKLLLKAYAQERVRFVRELQQSIAQPIQDAPAGNPLGFFRRGWLDLKAAMVVRRQRRHRLLLAELEQLESNTVSTYAKAATEELPSEIRAIVARQYDRIRAVHNRLALLAKQSEERVALHLFDEVGEADQAIARLAQLGIPRSDLAVIPVEQIAAYSNDQNARPRATREAIITGGILGLLAGGALGLLYGSFHRFYFPELRGLIGTTPTGVMLEMGLYGALIGFLFFLIFSTLIASSAAETDAYLYEDSFENGDTLVAVFTDRANITQVEQAIGVMHEHEIEPVLA